MPRIVCNSLAVSGVLRFFIDCNLSSLGWIPVGYVLLVELNLRLTELQLATVHAYVVLSRGVHHGLERLVVFFYCRACHDYIVRYSRDVLNAAVCRVKP